MLLKNKLVEALNQAEGERGIHAFLKKEPWLIWSTFMNSGGHSNYVIPEFSLAGKHRPDFVVMQSFSGGWNISLIELEPVDEKLFIKNGSPSKILRGAIKQIDDWKNFVYGERASLCSQLADAAQKYDTLYPEHTLAREPSSVKMPLRDPQTYLCCKYFIVMGRRSDLDEEHLHDKAKFYPNHNVEILTYDRFIEVAENLEQQNERYKNRNIGNRDKEFLAEFDKNPEQFSISSDQDTQRYPHELDIHGTCYKIRRTEEENEFVVDIINSTYVIVEDRRKFNLSRIEFDGISLGVAENLESFRAAIELAEIYERLIHFHIDTKHSLDLVDECLQMLIENPPYKVASSIE